MAKSEYPCGKCRRIKQHPYGHYYNYCGNCKEKFEYENNLEGDETDESQKDNDRPWTLPRK